MPSGQVRFQQKGCLVVFYYDYVLSNPVFNANSIEHDQTFCGVLSGSTLFANVPCMGHQA